jgi:hypothetical protein
MATNTWAAFSDVSGDPVVVNPLLVRFLKSYHRGETIIVFSNDHSIKVKGGLDAVRAELFGPAGREVVHEANAGR